MTADTSSSEPIPPPQFSLKGMFLLINCAAIVFAAWNWAPSNSDKRFWFAGMTLSGFLAVWFLVTRRYRYCMWSAVALVLVSFFPHTMSATRGPCGPSCSNNLKQIVLALLYYNQTHGSFPPAYVADSWGKPLYSWRVLLLPMLDESPLFQKFRLNEAWNGPTNGTPSQASLAVFHCPSEIDGPGMTDYVAVVGPNTAWPGVKGRKLSEIKDPSKTILLVEVADSGIQWAEPRDLYLGQMAPQVNAKAGMGISSHHKGGAYAGFADGHIEYLGDDTDPKKLAAMLDIDGGEK